VSKATCTILKQLFQMKFGTCYTDIWKPTAFTVLKMFMLLKYVFGLISSM